MPLDVGDFRLVDRRVLDVFNRMRESNRFVRGMFSWIGLRQTGVLYKREERFAGETKYPLRKMLRFATTGLISFSPAPLRFALRVGFFVSLFAFALAVWSLVVKLTGLYEVPGWTSIVVVVTFLGGMQLIMLGVIGEYIGDIHAEVKGRPLYVVGELENFSDDARAAAAGRGRPRTGDRMAAAAGVVEAPDRRLTAARARFGRRARTGRYTCAGARPAADTAASPSERQDPDGEQERVVVVRLVAEPDLVPSRRDRRRRRGSAPSSTGLAGSPSTVAVQRGSYVALSRTTAGRFACTVALKHAVLRSSPILCEDLARRARAAASCPRTSAGARLRRRTRRPGRCPATRGRDRMKSRMRLLEVRAVRGDRGGAIDDLEVAARLHLPEPVSAAARDQRRRHARACGRTGGSGTGR